MKVAPGEDIEIVTVPRGFDGVNLGREVWPVAFEAGEEVGVRLTINAYGRTYPGLASLQ